MRIRIVQIPPIEAVDGITLHCFEMGKEYEVGNSIGALFLAESWAVPVELDAPKLPEPFGPEDPFGMPTIDRNDPPNLVHDHTPPFLERAEAADLPMRWRRRRRT